MKDPKTKQLAVAEALRHDRFNSQLDTFADEIERMDPLDAYHETAVRRIGKRLGRDMKLKDISILKSPRKWLRKALEEKGVEL